MISGRLGGEVALVVGGTRNIGLGIAEALQAAGASVCIVGRSNAAGLERALERLESSGEAIGILADVAEEAGIRQVYNSVEKALGPPSILVNSAGLRPSAPLTSITREDWVAVVDAMLTGPFLASRELFRRLPAERLGAIVNLGGLTAYRPVPNRAHVIAAKAGLAGLTRALAEEGRGRIRVNCVAPGSIDTERAPGQPQAHHAGDAAYARGTIEAVVRAALYFCDPRDTYVTGQTVHVSGGRFMP
jgi:3-oxoacyl-[acyl-carrier protein] reductase